MIKFRILLFACSLLFIIGCKTSSKMTDTKKESIYKFDFVEMTEFSNVLDMAKSNNKLVFLDMSASWCAPCQLMKRDVYTHQGTADFFNANFINFLVDSEKGEGPDLKLIYGVTNYPTLLIIDGKGRVVHRKEGGTFHEGLIQFGKDGLAKAPTM